MSKLAMMLPNIKTLPIKATESKLKRAAKNVSYDYSHNGTPFLELMP